MVRKTITVKEFEAKYGFTWLDILRLGWLEDINEDSKPWYRCVEWNDCPSYHFFFDRCGMSIPEVYEDTAPALAEILKLHKEAQEAIDYKLCVAIGFHCFDDNYDNVYCVTGSEDNVEFKRFDLKKYFTY